MTELYHKQSTFKSLKQIKYNKRTAKNLFFTVRFYLYNFSYVVNESFGLFPTEAWVGD